MLQASLLKVDGRWHGNFSWYDFNLWEPTMSVPSFWRHHETIAINTSNRFAVRMDAAVSNYLEDTEPFVLRIEPRNFCLVWASGWWEKRKGWSCFSSTYLESGTNRHLTRAKSATVHKRQDCSLGCRYQTSTAEPVWLTQLHQSSQSSFLLSLQWNRTYDADTQTRWIACDDTVSSLQCDHWIVLPGTWKEHFCQQ